VKKGYWVVQYRDDNDIKSIDAYGEISVPLVQAAGGKILLGGMPSEVIEAGEMKRTVVVEFPSLQKAQTLRHSSEYAKAFNELGSSPIRDFRILEGLD
jgi:uncharacterized protein (DUF1330 family)